MPWSASKRRSWCPAGICTAAWLARILSSFTIRPNSLSFNSDNTDHNIHAAPKENPEWNESQQPKSPAILKQFNRPEIMVPVKCNQHPWMKMYVNVSSHPFFTVTDADGKFTISGLPPGTYTLAALHEKMGEKTMQLVVGPKETKSADFKFSSADVK